MVRRFRAGLALVMVVAVIVGPGARADTPAPVFDPAQLPHVQGVVRYYTLIPHGAVDGFVLEDGTQVLTAPLFSERVVRAAIRGERVTVYGLKAASVPIVMALAVTSDQSREPVILGEVPLLLALGGSLPGGHGTADAHTGAVAPAAEKPVDLQGTVVRPLYGPRGFVNGAILEDGTVLRVASTEAARVGPLLFPGSHLSVRGVLSESAVGRLVLVEAIGKAGSSLVTLAPWDGPR